MYLLKTLFSLSLFVLLTASFVEVSDSKTSEEHVVAERVDMSTLWESSCLKEAEISLKAFDHALNGYRNLIANSELTFGRHLTIVDFSQPSHRERLVVYDTELNAIVYTSLVAHGRNSGEEMATSFSNTVRSFQSSLGFFVTAETYEGKNGYSLRLDGLENGINDKARERAVVIHGADYATADFIEKYGLLGRSWGCPSLPPELNKPIIDQIKEQQVLFIYADNEHYLSTSAILNPEH